MRRIGFTGTRHGITSLQRSELERLLRDLRPGELHHGQCVGADAEAHDIALDFGVPAIIVHPSNDPTLTAVRAPGKSRVVSYLPPADPLKRNKAMVRAVDTLIAAPATAEEQVRSGTWFTIRFARRLGSVEVIVLPPT